MAYRPFPEVPAPAVLVEDGCLTAAGRLWLRQEIDRRTRARLGAKQGPRLFRSRPEPRHFLMVSDDPADALLFALDFNGRERGRP